MVNPINASGISTLRPKTETAAPQQKSGLFAASQAIIEQLRKPAAASAATAQVAEAKPTITPRTNLPRGSLVDVLV